ncbi:MAG: Fic family protein [Ferrovibrio sp.]
MFIWEQEAWPHFEWDKARLTKPLAEARHKQGLLLGQMGTLGFRLKEEALLNTLTQDVLKTSEIEGEKLDPDQVRSSIARRLGMDIAGLVPADRDVEGVVEMMLDATRNYNQPLTQDRLFGWHAALFPTGRSGMTKIIVGGWRDDRNGPMEVVSGPVGRERTHFVAPPAKRLEAETLSFLQWFNASDQDLDLVLKAGIAHLWFVTLHPFEDGNGRIARAVADMALARSENSSQRFYSMSAQIRLERKDYYNILENTQRRSLDITEWLEWFLGCFSRAIDGAQETLQAVMKKAHFWERLAIQALNERQTLMLNKLLDGFEGKLTTSKWAKICKCSQDTAYRDISDLMQRGILQKEEAGGRSTSYVMVDVSRIGQSSV